MRDASEYAEAVIETMHEPLVVLDGDLRIRKVNKAYYRIFQLTPAETEGKLIYELGNGRWDIPELRELLESVLQKNSKFEGMKVSSDFPKIGRRDLLFNGRRIPADAKEAPPKLILVAIEDATGR
jgi:two-component system CheB/CheR fusion protein